MKNYTDGPWKARRGMVFAINHIGESVLIADCPYRTSTNNEANALLISSAPMLIDHLEWAAGMLKALAEFNDYTEGMKKTIAHCEEVIAKARGEL